MTEEHWVQPSAADCKVVAWQYAIDGMRGVRGFWANVRDLMLAGFALLCMVSQAVGQEFTVSVEPSFTVSIEEPEEDGCYLVVFTTRNCAPCQRFKRDELPILQRAGHKVAIVDIDDHDQYGVSRVPTFWIVDRRTKTTVRKFVGYVRAETLLPLLKTRTKVTTTTATQAVPAPAQKQANVSVRMSHSEMVRLHNQLHGGGSWTWPGDLATHLRAVHHVEVD